MKSNFFLLLLISLVAISCNKENNDPYLISLDRIGPLSKEIKIHQLDSIFPNDSIVTQTSGSQQFRSTDEITIYEKGGNSLLLLEPSQEFDSTSTIGYIRILDSRFKTKEGLSLESNFKDIVKNYSISRIENTLNSAVVFLNDINAYITIDKKELPSNLRFSTEKRIRPSQIPDDAKIKYFMIDWE